MGKLLTYDEGLVIFRQHVLENIETSASSAREAEVLENLTEILTQKVD